MIRHRHEIESFERGAGYKSESVADVVNENSEVPYVDAFFTEKALDPEIETIRYDF